MSSYRMCNLELMARPALLCVGRPISVEMKELHSTSQSVSQSKRDAICYRDSYLTRNKLSISIPVRTPISNTGNDEDLNLLRHVPNSLTVEHVDNIFSSNVSRGTTSIGASTKTRNGTVDNLNSTLKRSIYVG